VLEEIVVVVIVAGAIDSLKHGSGIEFMKSYWNVCGMISRCSGFFLFSRVQDSIARMIVAFLIVD
jgi:hypothetical protein